MERILDKQKTYFIAEAGVSHNGSLSKAKKLVLAAKKAGADAVKFQSFITEEFLSDKKFLHPIGNKKLNAYNMFKRLEFKDKWYKTINDLCKINKIDFLTSVADIESAEKYLKYNKKILKIASDDIINYPFLKYLSSLKNKIIILSTGMASFEEIKLALEIMLNKKNTIILMHCVSVYPTKDRNINLNRILQLKKKFNIEVGFSDHTIGLNAIYAARSIGCRIFEKHFTLNTKDKGPDHFLSLDANDTKKAVYFVNNFNNFFGNGKIDPQGKELNSKKNYRRSIVANRIIKKGEIITEEKIWLRRPGTGLHPKFLNKVLGKKAKKTFRHNDKITL